MHDVLRQQLSAREIREQAPIVLRRRRVDGVEPTFMAAEASRRLDANHGLAILAQPLRECPPYPQTIVE